MCSMDYEALVRRAFSLVRGESVDVQGDPAGLARAGFFDGGGGVVSQGSKAAAMYAMAIFRKSYDNGVDDDRYRVADDMIEKMGETNSIRECENIIRDFFVKVIEKKD